MKQTCPVSCRKGLMGAIYSRFCKPLLLSFFLLQSLSLFSQKGVEISHYLFPEFGEGVVLMRDGRRNPAKLNYNAASEEMVFMQNEQKLAIAEPSLSQVDTLFLYDRKFVLHNMKFMEILHQGDFTLLAYYKCKVIPPGKPAGYGGTSQTSSVDSYSSWSMDGRVYDLKLPDDFEVKPFNIYYLNDGAGWKELKTLRQLKNHFKKSKKQLDQYMKEQKVNFEDAAAITRLIYFMETTDHSSLN